MRLLVISTYRIGRDHSSALFTETDIDNWRFVDAANRDKLTLSYLPGIQRTILPATNQLTSIWMPTQWCRLWRWMHWIRNITQWLTLTFKKTNLIIFTRLAFGRDRHWHLQYRRKLWPKPHDLDWMMQQQRAAAAYAKRIPCSQHLRLRIAPLCRNTESFSLLNSTRNTRNSFSFWNALEFADFSST